MLQSSHPSSRQQDSGKEAEEFLLALHLIDQNLLTQLHLDARESGKHSYYSEW